MATNSSDTNDEGVCEDALDDIRAVTGEQSVGITELYNLDCRLEESIEETSDRYHEARDLDDRKKALGDTYLDFNRKLWTGKIKQEEIPHTEEMIRTKLKEFQFSASNFGTMDISKQHCVLYREFQINGVSRMSTAGENKKRNRLIPSAFTNIINFPDYDVSLKTTKPTSEKKNQKTEIVVLKKPWYKATRDYLDRYYPTDGVFQIPPSLEYEDEIKVSKKFVVKDLLLFPDNKAVESRVRQSTTLKNEDVLKEHFNKRRGNNAEREILTAFEKWGRQTGQNMFIFGGYKYSNYLKNVAELKDLTSEQGEFDVLIISQQLGVIFVEVKGLVGGEHLRKQSEGERNGVKGGDGGNVQIVNDTVGGENDHCSEEHPGEQNRASEDGHGTKPVDFVYDHTKRNGDHRVTKKREEKCVNSVKTTNGLSFENPKEDVVQSNNSKCESSVKQDIWKYKKTASSSIRSEIQDGWCQLMKGNFVFREMNRDLSYVRKLPYKCFVGLPFLSRSDSIDVRICSHHQKYLIFSEELDDLRTWLRNNHFAEEYETLAMTREEFRELAARFAGLASAVTTEIDSIKFTNRKMMCTFLTPDQNAIISKEEKRNVLFGDYGTGKTFVLTRKATSLASPSGKPQCKSRKKKEISAVGSTINVVHVVPCADVSNFKSCYGVAFSDQSQDILKFVKTDDKENENVKLYKSFLDFFVEATMSSPDPNTEVDTKMVIQAVTKFAENVSTKIDSEKAQQCIRNGNFLCEKDGEVESGEKHQKKVVHHFFFDEFPVHPLKGGALQTLQKFFFDYLQDSFLWISVATHSLGVSSDENPLNVLRKELSVQCGESGVLVCYLRDVMRVSGELYRMIKQIESFIDKGHFDHSNLGHMLKGIKPRLFRLPKRKCVVYGNNPLGCNCQVTNLASTLRRILDSCVDKGEPLVVKILIYYVMSTPMFRRLRGLLTRVARVLDIELTWNTMQSRYTGETSTTFTDGLNRAADPLSDGISDDLEDSVSVIHDSELTLKNRSSCPAEDYEPSEVKKPSLKWNIQVVDQRTFAGCETPVLIFIDPFGMRHWFKRGNGKGSGYHSLIFTRCTGHFNLITWPDEEAKGMWNQHLDEYEAEVRDSDASENYKKGRFEYINTGRKATENCLQMLLLKDLITNMDGKKTEITK